MEESPHADRDAIICDGAVRSGKSLSMSLSFILWAMSRFNGCNFAICGKTIASTERNVIRPLQPIVTDNLKMSFNYSRVKGYAEVSNGKRTNYFYVFGGKDEGSAALIQGVTLAGILLDEVALMPRSFVDQALARCSVDGSKFWFNCNPEHPEHYFYKEWIKGRQEKNAYYLHFVMDDNPSLTDSIIERYKKLYTGVFASRYIKGLWVRAEGAIYVQFADNPHHYIIDEPPDDIVDVRIGVDFGGNKSATMFIATGFTRKYKQVVVLAEEYRPAATENPATLNKAFVEFCTRIKDCYPMAFFVYCDSAEQILIRGLRAEALQAGLPVQVCDARKSEIIGRIRLVNSLIAREKFKVMSTCTELIASLKTAVWDAKKLEDVRLDDGSYNCDALDSLEYSLEPVAGWLTVLK